jgi:hypothetical protein
VVERRSQRPAAVLLPTIARDGDQDSGRGQFPAEPDGNVIAVQAGQAEVQQHMPRPLAERDLDRPTTVQGGPDVVAVYPQQARQGLGRIRIIIHNQDG